MADAAASSAGDAPVDERAAGHACIDVYNFYHKRNCHSVDVNVFDTVRIGPVIQGGVRADVLPALQAQLPGARIVLRKRSVQRAPALLGF